MTTDSPLPRLGRTVSLLGKHPIASFVVLALAISWALWIPLFVAVPSPTSIVMMPGAFGPALAAVIVLRSQGNPIRPWLVDGLNWRISKRWYVVALGLPVGLGVLLGGGLVMLTGSFETARLVQTVVIYPVMLLALTLVGGGQEELGWRGFALPALQERYDALIASAVIGIVWAVWHLPAFAFGIPGYTSSFALYTLLVVGISIVLTWLYNSSGGSVLLAMLLHGGLNAAPSLGTLFVGDPASLRVSPFLILVPAVWAIALTLLVRYGRETLSAHPVVEKGTRDSRDMITDTSA